MKKKKKTLASLKIMAIVFRLLVRLLVGW